MRILKLVFVLIAIFYFGVIAYGIAMRVSESPDETYARETAQECTAQGMVPKVYRDQNNKVLGVSCNNKEDH